MIKNILLVAVGTLLAACSGSGLPHAAAPALGASACEAGSVNGDAELEQYARCTTVAGDLEISRVTSVKALEHLRSVDGTLTIRETDHLYSLAGLEHLRRVNVLRLEKNRGLISIGSLNALARAEKVSIVQNPRLSRTHGLMAGLRHAVAEVTLVDNLGLRAEGVTMASGPSVF